MFATAIRSFRFCRNTAILRNSAVRSSFKSGEIYDRKWSLKSDPFVNFVPPWIVMKIGMLGKPFAVMVGRGLRGRYKKMPKGDRDKLHRKLVLVFSGSVVAGVLLYLSHIEEAPLTGRRRFVLVSRETILEMASEEGNMLALQLGSKILPPSHPSYATVRRVASKLLAQAPKMNMDRDEWKISVVQGEDMNAFVLPSGWIFVFTGLLDICENDDRLSIILAHEIAHCLIGHQQEMASQATLLQFLLFIPLLALWMVLPTDSVSVLSGKVAEMISDFFLKLPHNRTMEREADFVGLQLSADACYDVREAVIFWKMMMLHEKSNSAPAVPELLSTHPSHESRLATIERLLPEMLERRADKGCPILNRRDMSRIFNALDEAASRSEKNGVPIDWSELSPRLK